MSVLKKSCLAALILLETAFGAAAQHWSVSDTQVHSLVWEGKLEKNIGFLASDFCEGRGFGTRGGSAAAFWIAGRLDRTRLCRFGDSWSRAFIGSGGQVGHNIVAMVPSSTKNPSDKYIIIGAHYDHIGLLDGKVYPGADDNASGVETLCCLAEMFSFSKMVGKTYGTSLILVFFDGKERDFSGSQAFARHIAEGLFADPVSGRRIDLKDIVAMVDIDQIGSSLAPLSKGRKDYLIALGNETLRGERRDWLESCNRQYGTGLQIGYSYYGSENFSRIFYNLGDHRTFVERGIPTVFLTSGITMNTNKTRDLPETLDYGVLKKRIILIFHWLERLAR